MTVGLADLSVLCVQIVLENSSREDKHECPFGRSSIELTKMLCEILKVGELRKCRHPPNPPPLPGPSQERPLC